MPPINRQQQKWDYCPTSELQLNENNEDNTSIEDTMTVYDYIHKFPPKSRHPNQTSQDNYKGIYNGYVKDYTENVRLKVLTFDKLPKYDYKKKEEWGLKESLKHKFHADHYQQRNAISKFDLHNLNVKEENFTSIWQ